MQLLGEGCSTLEIAKTLGCDHRTIKKVANIVTRSRQDKSRNSRPNSQDRTIYNF